MSGHARHQHMQLDLTHLRQQIIGPREMQRYEEVRSVPCVLDLFTSYLCSAVIYQYENMTIATRFRSADMETMLR